MPAFVALLRGINNIGKTRRVPMADLRALLLAMGYTDVTTLLNSGNAVFRARSGTSAIHAARIADAIAAKFGFPVPVIVKSAKELAAIVADNPIAAEPDEHSRFLVAFVKDAKALATLVAIEPLVVHPERFAIGKKAGFLFCAGGISDSKAGRALLGKVGPSVTTRNLATTLKLHALVSSDDG